MKTLYSAESKTTIYIQNVTDGIVSGSASSSASATASSASEAQLNSDKLSLDLALNIANELVKSSNETRILTDSHTESIISILPTIIPTTLTSPINEIIVFVSSDYEKGFKLLDLFVNEEKLLNQVDLYYYPTNTPKLDLVKAYSRCYNLGYRVFIDPCEGSNTLLSYLLPFFESHPDALYLNTGSTAAFTFELPKNIIRSSVNDDELCEFQLNVLNYKIVDLLSLGKNNEEILKKLDNNKPLDEPVFSNVVYIYQEGTYTDNYLKSLHRANASSGNKLNIQSFIVTDKLMPEIIDLLEENPVSNPDYVNTKKTLFIVNSTNSRDIVSLFTEESWNDNFFFFTDTFQIDDLKINFPFLYAFMPIANFSTEGFKLSKFVDKTQTIGAQFLNVVNLIVQLSSFLKENKNNKMNDLIDKLIKYNFFIREKYNNLYWYEQQIYIYHMLSNKLPDGDLVFAGKIVFFKYSFNPTVIGSISQNTDYEPYYELRDYLFQLITNLLYPYPPLSNSPTYDDYKKYYEFIDTLKYRWQDDNPDYVLDESREFNEQGVYDIGPIYLIELIDNLSQSVSFTEKTNFKESVIKDTNLYITYFKSVYNFEMNRLSDLKNQVKYEYMEFGNKLKIILGKIQNIKIN